MNLEGKQEKDCWEICRTQIWNILWMLQKMSSWFMFTHKCLHDGVVRSVHVGVQWEGALSLAVICCIAFWSNDPVLRANMGEKEVKMCHCGVLPLITVSLNFCLTSDPVQGFRVSGQKVGCTLDRVTRPSQGQSTGNITCAHSHIQQK